MKKKYKAVLLDLFGTLVRFDQNKLPRITLDGFRIPSTAGRLFALLNDHASHISPETFYNRIFEVREEINRAKENGYKEVNSAERFKKVLRGLQISSQNGLAELADALTREHMKHLKNCVTFPDSHAPIMEKLSRRYRIALVSNFDHAPTGYQILEENQLIPFFRAILFSDEIGWCKPHPIIFSKALDQLQVSPEEALFVGDTPEFDVLGPKNFGMDVAWINSEDRPLPSFYPEPDYTLTQFTDLSELID